jgi:hypothetical protein
VKIPDDFGLLESEVNACLNTRGALIVGLVLLKKQMKVMLSRNSMLLLSAKIGNQQLEVNI